MLATLITSWHSQILGGVKTRLSSPQCRSIATAVNKGCQDLSQEYQPELVGAIAQDAISTYLTQENSSAIKLFNDGEYPFLLIKGAIDVSDLPPTPIDDSAPDEATWRVQAATLLGYLKLAKSNALAFEDEMGGRLFHMVMPAQNHLASMLRSTKALNFHTEVVNGLFNEEQPSKGSPVSPEKFALACLRNPHRVATTVLPLAQVLQNLSPETIHVLKQPLFTAKSQSSFDRKIEIRDVPALLPLRFGGLGIRYSHSKLAATSPDAVKALNELQMVIGSFDESWSLALEPGDVLILNNRLCLHGRSEVSSTSNFDGSDRWLLRLYGYADETLDYLSLKPPHQHVMTVNTTSPHFRRQLNQIQYVHNNHTSIGR